MSPMVKFLSRKPLSSGAILGIFLEIFFLCPPPAGASVPEYDLARMRQVNPDFSTYPDARGIVWLKRVSRRTSPEPKSRTPRFMAWTEKSGQATATETTRARLGIENKEILSKKKRRLVSS